MFPGRRGCSDDTCTPTASGTTAADGSMLMIEIQAKGWQECIEVLADQVEPWADA